MNKTRLIFIWSALFFLISGCAALNKSQQDAVKKIMKEEDARSYKIKPINLDKDGTKEAVVIYDFGTHHSGIKVIEFNDEKTDVLFEKVSSSANIEFKAHKDKPIIIIEESDYTPDYAAGKRYKEIYQWNGKTFEMIK